MKKNLIKIIIGGIIIGIFGAIIGFVLRKDCMTGPCDGLPAFSQAVDRGNIEDCSFIEEYDSSLLATYCVDYCRAEIATESDDPTNCELIEDVSLKNSCYLVLSRKLKDISLCSKIEPYEYSIMDKDFCESLYSKE